MRLNHSEITLITGLALLGGAERDVLLTDLERFFNRRQKLHATCQVLYRHGVIHYDRYHAGVARLHLLRALELMDQRPDSNQLQLIENSDVCVPDAVQCVKTPAEHVRSVLEKPPNPRSGARGIPAVPHENMPSMPMPIMPHAMPPLRKGHVHVHETCNSGSTRQLHEHGHEVGELEKRSTEQIMADIRRLAPELKTEYIEQWRRRIYEKATLVNAVVREATLQRRTIRNTAAWMNAEYLKGIRAEL